MAARRLRVVEGALEAIRGLHPDGRRLVREALDALIADPYLGTELRAELVGSRRVGVGRLRIVYRVGRSTIDIVAVGPRATVYEELTARVLRERRKKA